MPLLKRLRTSGVDGVLSTSGSTSIGSGNWQRIVVNVGHTLTINHGSDVRVGTMIVNGAISVGQTAANATGNGGTASNVNTLLTGGGGGGGGAGHQGGGSPGNAGVGTWA